MFCACTLHTHVRSIINWIITTPNTTIYLGEIMHRTPNHTVHDLLQSLNEFSLRSYALDDRVWAGITRKLIAVHNERTRCFMLSEKSFRDCGIHCSLCTVLYTRSSVVLGTCSHLESLHHTCLNGAQIFNKLLLKFDYLFWSMSGNYVVYYY